MSDLEKLPSSPACSPASEDCPSLSEIDAALFLAHSRVAQNIELLSQSGALSLSFDCHALLDSSARPLGTLLRCSEGFLSLAPFSAEGPLGAFSSLASKIRLRLLGPDRFAEHAWRAAAAFICKTDVAHRMLRLLPAPPPLDNAPSFGGEGFSMGSADLAIFSAERRRSMSARAEAEFRRLILNRAIAQRFTANLGELEACRKMTHLGAKVDVLTSGQLLIRSNTYVDADGALSELPPWCTLSLSVFVDPLSPKPARALSRLVESWRLSRMGQDAYVDRLWACVGTDVDRAGAFLRLHARLPAPAGILADQERLIFSEAIPCGSPGEPPTPKKRRSL